MSADAKKGGAPNKNKDERLDRHPADAMGGIKPVAKKGGSGAGNWGRMEDDDNYEPKGVTVNKVVVAEDTSSHNVDKGADDE